MTKAEDKIKNIKEAMEVFENWLAELDKNKEKKTDKKEEKKKAEKDSDSESEVGFLSYEIQKILLLLLCSSKEVRQ